MTTQQRTYRGVSYDPSQQEQASSTTVEHIYRGLHYSASLRHEAAVPDTTVELHYRGNIYHHRQQEIQNQLAR